MPITESVLWTALPNGVRGDALSVTVFVSPRLSAGGASSLPLAEAPAFADWPTALAELHFAVEVEGIGLLDTELDPASTRPDPATWRLLFGGDVTVTAGEFNDLSTRRMRSFPASIVDDYVLGLYGDVATTFPTAFPPVTTGPLSTLADHLGDLGDDRREHYQALDNLFVDVSLIHDLRGRYVVLEGVSLAERQRLAFLQAYRFYDRFAAGQSVRQPHGPLDPTNVPPGPVQPQIDFHGYLAFLGDYPLLLRPLGIAIDLLAHAEPGIQRVGRVRVQVDAPAAMWWATPVAARPWTNYQLDAARFIARPREEEGELVDGTLRLESDRHFRVHQIDIDGTALKTVDFAATVMRLKGHVQGKARSMTEDAASVPALRGAGFTVTRLDRAARVVRQFDEALVHQQRLESSPPQPAELFAEDVTRGYRVDVEPDGGRFRSLCARTGTYVIDTPDGPQVVDVPADVGYAKASSTTSVPGDADELYLHEAVFSWSGWSLVAARPGQRVMPDETIDDGSTPPVTDPGVPLTTSFQPTPGTLPRLRYGSTYRFRARAVDLAGNSIGDDAIEPSHVTEAQTFRRWEPVPSPTLIPRRPFGEGESLLRMVVRSTLGIAPVDYVELPRVVGLTGHTDPLHVYRGADERWLAAPKTSQQMAELHGMFDPAIGVDRAQGAVDDGFDVGVRESGSFLQPVAGAFVFNPVGNPPTELTTLPAGAPLQPGEYVCIDSDDLELPYLPDVASRGVSLTTLPNDTAANTPSRVIQWPSGGPWHERRPLRLCLEAGPGPAPVTPTGAVATPSYNATARLLTVHVPQAEMVAVRISSAPARGDLEVFGVWNLLGPAAQGVQLPAAESGRLWMLSPGQTVVFVHAVEKPLLAPVVDVAPSGMQRQLGETFCALVGSIDIHAKSTGRVDVEAAWEEQVDDVLRDLPEDGVDGRPRRSGFAHVGDFAVDADEDDCRVGRDDVAAVAASAAVHQLRHQLGDTRHRTVRYHAVATTRFREYFPPEIISGVDPATGERFITHVGNETALGVPSSHRPEPPDVLYSVPTFTWSEHVTGGDGAGAVTALSETIHRRRQGGGLRVYLRRPWFSSGDGELLGVVLKNQAWLTWPIDVQLGMAVDAAAIAQADAVAARLVERGVVRPRGSARQSPSERLVASLRATVDLVAAADAFATLDVVLDEVVLGILGGIDPDKLTTHWGADPMWGSPLPADGPFIHQFPLRVAVGTGLSLAETDRAPVAVVGHRPQYDPARQLWFCDLQINAGSSYFPFVRPALCRFQPDAIPGAQLSPVVLADYAQLLVDRSASLTRSGSSATVTVRGPAGFGETATFVGVGDAAGAVRMSRFVTAQVERLNAGDNPDLSWVPVAEEQTLALSTPGGLADVQWSGSIPLPVEPPGATQRVAVREYEILESDPYVAEATLTHHPALPPTMTRPVRYRLVYADHLAV